MEPLYYLTSHEAADLLARRQVSSVELTRAGRALLAMRHDPRQVAERLCAIYASVAGGAAAARALTPLRDPPAVTGAAP